MTTALEAALAAMVQAGVRTCYTVPGESFLPLLDAIDHHPELTLISTRHESGAAFMAEAEAKTTGRPAVVMATRGVGAANASIGVHTARQDSTPMVVLLGQVPRTHRYREAFQEIDLEAFYAPLVKAAATLPQAERFPELMARSLSTAVSGRPGPVMLALPTDVLEETAYTPAALAPGSRLMPAEPGNEAVELLATSLREAVAPVIIAGGGARACVRDLVAVAGRYDVGIYTAFRRQDAFPNNDPHYLGHLGLGASPELTGALRAADVVVVLGCRLSEITTQGYSLPGRSASVIHIDTDPDVVATAAPGSIGVMADCGATLRRLLRAPSAPPRDRDWSAARRTCLAEASLPEIVEGAPMNAFGGLAVMREMLPRDAIITNDAGNFSAFLHRYWGYDHPNTQVAPTNGAMGYAVPAAVGAKLANPGRPVVAVVGDGGFLMSGQEVETATRYGLPIIVIVFNNSMYGTIAMHMARAYGRTCATDILPVDVGGFARSLGAIGRTARNLASLRSALAEAMNADLPTVIDVVIDRDLISPTTTLSQLMST